MNAVYPCRGKQSSQLNDHCTGIISNGHLHLNNTNGTKIEGSRNLAQPNAASFFSHQWNDLNDTSVALNSANTPKPINNELNYPIDFSSPSVPNYLFSSVTEKQGELAQSNSFPKLFTNVNKNIDSSAPVKNSEENSPNRPPRFTDHLNEAQVLKFQNYSKQTVKRVSLYSLFNECENSDTDIDPKLITPTLIIKSNPNMLIQNPYNHTTNKVHPLKSIALVGNGIFDRKNVTNTMLMEEVQKDISGPIIKTKPNYLINASGKAVEQNVQRDIKEAVIISKKCDSASEIYMESETSNNTHTEDIVNSTVVNGQCNSFTKNYTSLDKKDILDNANTMNLPNNTLHTKAKMVKWKSSLSILVPETEDVQKNQMNYLVEYNSEPSVPNRNLDSSQYIISQIFDPSQMSELNFFINNYAITNGINDKYLLPFLKTYSLPATIFQANKLNLPSSHVLQEKCLSRENCLLVPDKIIKQKIINTTKETLLKITDEKNNFNNGISDKIVNGNKKYFKNLNLGDNKKINEGAGWENAIKSHFVVDLADSKPILKNAFKELIPLNGLATGLQRIIGSNYACSIQSLPKLATTNEIQVQHIKTHSVYANANSTQLIQKMNNPYPGGDLFYSTSAQEEVLLHRNKTQHSNIFTINSNNRGCVDNTKVECEEDLQEKEVLTDFSIIEQMCNKMKSDDDHEFSLVSQDIIPFQQCAPSELESRSSNRCLDIEALPLQRVTNGKENFLRNREYFINGSSTHINNSIPRHVSHSKGMNTDDLHENTKISPFNMDQNRDSGGQNQVDNSFISNSPLIPYEEEKIRNNSMAKYPKIANDKVPFTDPELKRQEFLSKINSSDWRKKCEALHIMKILSKHHTNNMNITEYSQAIRHIIQEVKNLRSAVSRLAINTLKDIFSYSMDPMSLNFESVCECLLNKTSESNAFIRDDVDKCLEEVVEKIIPCKIAQTLIFYGSGHKSSVVRMYTCKSLSKLVSLPMDEPIFMSNTDQDLKPFLGQILLPVVSKFAFDCCNKTRFYAKEVLFKIMTEPNFENYLRSCLNSQDLRDIQKILYSLRTKGLENSVLQSVKDIARKSHTKNNTSNGQIIKKFHSPIDKFVSCSPISNESQNSNGNKGLGKLSQSQISNGFNHQSNNNTTQSHIPNGYKSTPPSKIPVKLNGLYSIKNGIKSRHLNGHHESSDSSLSLGAPQNSNTTNSTDSSYGGANDIFLNTNVDSDKKKCLPIHRNKSRAYANMVRKSKSFCRGEQMPITPSPDPIITLDAYNGNSRFERKWKDIKRSSSNIMAEMGSVSQIPSFVNRSNCANFNGTSLNACQFLPPSNCRQGQRWRQSDMCINRPKPRSKSTSLIKQSPSFKSTFHLVKSNNAIEYHPIVLNWNGNGKFSITPNQLIENVIDDILRGDFKRKIAAMERLKDVVVALCQASWTDSNPKIVISLRIESLDQMDRTTNTPLDLTFNKSLLWNELDAKAYKIFDAFLPRLTDTNSKIQLSSLQTLQDLTVLIKMSPGSLGSLVPNVISCLASKIPDIQECASNLLNRWTNELDGTYLLKPLVNQAQHGNIHIRTIIIDKIASLVDILLHSKPKQTKIHLIPLLKELLKSVKMTGATVRGGGYPFEESFKNLLKIIHNHVGGEELFNYFKPIDPSEQAFIMRCFKLNTNEYV